MSYELRTHAVREFHRNEEAFDLNAEEVRNLGYTIIDGGFSADELQAMREKIDRIYEQQVREIGGEEALKRMNDADMARCLLGYDDFFLNVAIHPGVMAIVRKLMGEYFMLMSQNGVINRPVDAHYQITWHRDLNYQHFVSSRPLAMSALVCVDDFSDETGGTHLLPASHKSELFPSPEYIAMHEKVVEAKAGSIIVFDAMVYHRSGNNRSLGIRRAVNHIYTLPLIKQQISFPRMLDGKFSDDPFLRFFLGYDYETAESVQSWREKKLAAAPPAVGAAAHA